MLRNKKSDGHGEMWDSSRKVIILKDPRTREAETSGSCDFAVGVPKSVHSSFSE